MYRTIHLCKVYAGVVFLFVQFNELSPCRGEATTVAAIGREVLDEPAPSYTYVTTRVADSTYHTPFATV